METRSDARNSLPAPPPPPGAPPMRGGARAGLSIALAVAVGMAVLYLGPLAVMYAWGGSAQAAVADANRMAEGAYTYSLEREYADDEGRTVYRLASDTDPAIVRELRFAFRWLPEPGFSPGAPLPSIDMPGPYYELLNEKEWRESLIEWRRANMGNKAESSS